VAIGDRVEFKDGYSFYETLWGPMVQGQCEDCGQPAMVVGVTDRVNEWGLKEDTGGGTPLRCNNCARMASGLPALSHVNLATTLVDMVGDARCRFQAGSLYCITHNCANPHHRSRM
jgi:hypothetical protein